MKRWKRDIDEPGVRFELLLGGWHFSAVRLTYATWRFAVNLFEGCLYWGHWSFNVTRVPTFELPVDVYVPEPASDGL